MRADPTGGYRLGIDFGTSTTVAVLESGPEGGLGPGRQLLLFDSSPLLASAVFGTGTATLLTGADAERAAAADPAGLETNPKRRIDEDSVWLGGHAYPVVELVGAVLGRVADEARRVAGAVPAQVVLTHPAGWGRPRLALLADAARRAGLGEVTFVAEPVAAAAYFTSVLGKAIPPGQVLLVYDLGAGTFDVSVVRDGEVVGEHGLSDVGGLDLDAAVVEHARSLTWGDALAWQRLDTPGTPEDRHARALLWRGARAVKEQLSRHVAADLHLPLLQQDLHLTRDEFDALAGPLLQRTVDCTLLVLRDSGVAAADIGGLLLVGGSSRIPLVATLLHRALGVAPTVIDQPELVVANGSLHAVRPAPQPEPQPVAAPPAPRGRRPALGVAAVALVLVVVLATAVMFMLPDDNANTTPQAAKSAPATSAGPSPARDRGKPLRTFAGHTDPVTGIAFGADGHTMATASDDKTIRLWDLNGAGDQPTRTLTDPGDGVAAVAISPDGHSLAGASSDGAVRVWDLQSTAAPVKLAGHPDGALVVVFLDDRTLISAGSDGLVRWWNLATRKATRTINTDDIPVTLAPSQDNSTIMIGTSDAVRVWNVASGTKSSPVASTSGIFDFVTISRDRTRIATCSTDDPAARIYDPATKAQTKFGLDAKGIYGVALSPDGRLLATGLSTGVVKLWDTGHPEAELRTLDNPQPTTAMAFSPDGAWLVTASIDDDVRVYDVADLTRR